MFNYPNNKKIKNQKTFNFTEEKSKGMSFEEEITKANNYYLANDIAHIYKKPTPIKILDVKNYNENFEKKSLITKAVFEKRSTTDYNGLYKGFYIDFEAKETVNLKFNINSNLHEHQKKHLLSIYKHGGVAFVLLNMKKYNKVFLIEINKLIEEKKSQVTIDYLIENGYEIEVNNIYLDYLKAVDEILKRRING